MYFHTHAVVTSRARPQHTPSPLPDLVLAHGLAAGARLDRHAPVVRLHLARRAQLPGAALGVHQRDGVVLLGVVVTQIATYTKSKRKLTGEGGKKKRRKAIKASDRRGR